MSLEKRLGYIVKFSQENQNDSKKYTEYCIGQVQKEIEGLNLCNEYYLNSDFQVIQSELKELKRLLDEDDPVSKPPLSENYLSEIDRLLQANSRLEDEIAELQRKEEEIIVNKWW